MVKYNFLFHFFLLLDVIVGSIQLVYKPLVLIYTINLLGGKKYYQPVHLVVFSLSVNE